MTDYPNIKLDAADQKALRSMGDKQVAVQQYVATVQQQGEQRLEQLQSEGRKIWEGLKEKHDLDLKHVDYVPNDDGTELVAMRVRFDAPK